MRLIVACTECKRQYDASGKKPGARFRCHCGAAVTVQNPQGHDAKVVRCASCAAPREGNAAACAHCGADFTIHERDLHTVCPNCLARISDSARYCHHCATPLTAELMASETTEYTCPVCGDGHSLTSRRMTDQQVTVLECQRCAGLWLGLDTFRHLLDAQARKPQQAASRSRPYTRQAGPTYRPCVICKKLMTRRNFGQGESGVILDICGVHGIWFDDEELSHLIAWIRSGGLPAAQADMARLQSTKDRVAKREAFRQQSHAMKKKSPASNTAIPSTFANEDDPLGDIAVAVSQTLGRLFRLM